MAKIYISCGFRPGEKAWGDWGARALSANGQQPVWYGIGGVSSSAALEQAKREMPGCRALIAFVHHRGEGHMPPGVRDELMLAANAGIPIIAFWHPDVTHVDGLLAQAVMQRVPFPAGEDEAVRTTATLLDWARKLDREAFTGALKAIAGIVGGIWLLSKISDDEEEDDDLALIR